MKLLAILDETFVIRSRVKELAHRANYSVIETTTPRQLINILNVPNNIGLIITELEFSQEDRFEVFSRIKKSAGDIPVMILTSDNSRADFLKSIRLGAVDYVLKPIDGDFLYKRIVDLMGDTKHGKANSDSLTLGQGISSITIDFTKYVEKELKKAHKAQYAVSILISLIIDPVNMDESYSDKRYQLISNAVYDKLTTVLFDTDVFLKFSSRSFIGVFPFCDIENRTIIKNKLLLAFEDYKNEANEEHLILLNQFSSYPFEGEDHEVLLRIVEDRMAENINLLLSNEPLEE